MLIVLLKLFPESRPNIVSKTFRTKPWRPFHLRQLRIQFAKTKRGKKWCNWLVLRFIFFIFYFLFFFFYSGLGVYQSVAKHGRHLMFSNFKELYDKLPKHLDTAIKKLFYSIPRGAKNGKNAKIVKISHFFFIFKLTYLVRKSL